MNTFEFTSNQKPTVGIELELALVDRGTWELASQVGDVLAQLDEDSAMSVKPELVQCCVEINTGDEVEMRLENGIVTLQVVNRAAASP